MRGVLTITCIKCTRQAQFMAERQIDAAEAARRKGWVSTSAGAICPKCPGGGKR